MLSDRESDIYEYLLAAQQQGRDVVLRAREEQRGLNGEHLQLWPHLLLSPVAGTIELRVPRKGKQPPRIATMELRCQPVTLRPPAGKPGLPVVPVWAVLAREPNTPPEIKQPLEWLLLSSVPVTGLADAIERVQWYAVRWGIAMVDREVSLLPAPQNAQCRGDGALAWRQDGTCHQQQDVLPGRAGEHLGQAGKPRQQARRQGRLAGCGDGIGLLHPIRRIDSAESQQAPVTP